LKYFRPKITLKSIQQVVIELFEELKFLRRKFNEGEHFPLRTGNNGTFIFIHINKTAGTSLGKVIGLPHKRHLPVTRLVHLVGEKRFNKAYKFSVVRNPWDRAVSHYKYLARKKYYNVDPEKVSFKEWLIATYGDRKDPFYLYNPIMFADQITWLTDANGNLRVDNIIRFENLEEEFKDVADVIGVSSELPRLNATEKIHYSSFYDEETMEIVQRHSRRDIETFGYSFEQV
jgi:chondroitin 4-sulfotransferase 11